MFVERNAFVDTRPVVVAMVSILDQPNLLTRKLSEGEFELTGEINGLILTAEMNAELTSLDATVAVAGGGTNSCLTRSLPAFLRARTFLCSTLSTAHSSLKAV